MDIALLIFGFLFCLLGVFGSFLPVLPGPPVSWIGLLLLHLTKAVPQNWTFLGITAAVALVIFAMDYVIPAIGTKKFGGSKYGMIGTTIGLIVGLLSPIPGGIIIGPFIGAFIGELMNNADKASAIKAAFGSFLGFLTGTFLKFVTAMVFTGLFLGKMWDYRETLFPFLY